MDRFIAWGKGTQGTAQQDLKSNMDRFIVEIITRARTNIAHLKSNMDRFIVSVLKSFLIQTGI